MKWFCPNCWQEIEKETNKCPHCNYDLTEFEKISYEDKLILALKNPIRDHRMFSIYMLGQILSPKAVKPLYELACSSSDTIELFYIAKTLKLINTKESIKYLYKLKEKNNMLLTNFINKLEEKYGN
ncbi:MAG: HEAT repeat domain-containing protein [Desulfurella sp.]|uniref:HEAT repeat domain-containing protein n=1 Tax=Desulfurella sp. TaxID=1962857 RepID=UPI003D0A1C99